MSTAATATKTAETKAGLAFWMQRVLEECDRASLAFAADPVHDLRVALRRCRSLADGLMAMDPDPEWRRMKKAGKQLFSRLGELRDVQVMEQWVGRLGQPDDPVAAPLLQFLAGRELQLKQEAAQALQAFDRKQWKRSATSLPRRSARLREGSILFQHLALERWTAARTLHSRALRNRSQVSFHRLRIGLKRFRYIVENFLPQQHSAWIEDLKALQDLLGEVHDLDVLWATALRINAFPDAGTRALWRGRISEERTKRIEQYRERMVGEAALWPVWLAELPQGGRVKSAGLARLKRWASLLDPDFKHSRHVARLALQLFDGVSANGQRPAEARGNEREILELAALMHDVGMAKTAKGHHKKSYRMIQKLPAPLGIRKEDLNLAAAVARYHRGALPRAGQEAIRGLPAEQRQTVVRLAGILRLASAFDAERDGRIQRLEVVSKNGFLVVSAEGYSARDRQAETIASARHLLEMVYRRPVMVKPMAVKQAKAQ